MPKNYVAFVGELPSGVHAAVSKHCLGVYEEQSGVLHNARPCYRKIGDDNLINQYMIWSCNTTHNGDVWIVGNSANLGRTNGFLFLHGSDAPLEQASGTWRASMANRTLGPAPDLRMLGDAAPNDVQETGGRTREEKDAQLRKRAVDLEYDTPRKRSRT